MALMPSPIIIKSCTPQAPVASVDWLPLWCYLLLPLEFISCSSVMVKILLHHILSILQIHTIIRDSPAQQDPLPQASSQGSQDPLVQLLVLAALSPDNKDMEIQDQVSGPAWERGESWDICSAAIERRHPFQTPGPTHLIAPHTPARGVARLTRRFVEAQVALQHVQVQRQKPEQHQDMVVPEDDKKVKS